MLSVFIVISPPMFRYLVNFTTTIPPTLKVKQRKNRYIFKRAMANFLPSEIVKKKKQGMGLPIAPWFKSDTGLSNLLNDTVFSTNPRISEYVRPDFINFMRQEFETDTTSYYGSNLWPYLIFELWLRN